MPPTTKRVRLQTPSSVNKEIYIRTLKNISRYDEYTHREIALRIKELNREWDTERVLEANAGFFSFVAIILGYFVHAWWFLLAGGIAFFLLYHAIKGWCPPLPIIRRMGVRTAEEIFKEKMALQVMKGGFQEAKQDIGLLMERIEE